MKKILVSLLLALSVCTLYAVIPAGYYYKADGLKKEALKSALNDIASNGKFLSYGEKGVGYTWEGFYYTDRNESDSSVIDMYSNEKFKFPYDEKNNPTFGGVKGMHIEHSLPKSWWGSIEYNAYKDLNHLFPAEGSINSAKNNSPLGIVGTPTSDNGVSKVGNNTFGSEYTGSCFEPADEYKGVFARAYFYVATVYEEFANIWDSPMMDNNTYPVWKPWALELLLQWHREHPVSERERERNELVYGVQGNRNPFIDYPELVEYIWGNKTEETYEFPEESRAFLVSPTRWDHYNFGVVKQGNVFTEKFILEGYNLTSSVQLKIKQASPAFKLSKAFVSANEALQGDCEITLTFTADEIGEYNDTITIWGGGLSEQIDIPLKANVTDEFMALEATDILPSTACLNWMQLNGVSDYSVDVFQGIEAASDLMLSYYICGSSWNKALAIYNGTGHDVDLSRYSLRKQNNGVGSFRGEQKLNGIIKNGETYVMVHMGAVDAIKAMADTIMGTSSNDNETIVSFSGNDALALYHSGVKIDVLGVVDNSDDWGKGLTLTRKSVCAGPSTQFDWSEWQVKAKDYYTNLNSHSADFSARKYHLQKASAGAATSLKVNGLQPNTSYFYCVTAGGQTSNIVRFVTANLEAPEAMDAAVVYSNQFVPTWESVPGASQKYLLDVFQLEGEGIIVEAEGFDSLLTNKALVEAKGWSFGTTGTSTGAAYVGKSAPCVAFQNEGDVLSKVYPDTVVELTFMYRYGAKKAKGEGTDSASLTLDAYNGTDWINIDTLKADSTTNKYYPVYKFARDLGYTQFRWIYTHKIYGSVTFDDVAASMGEPQDTTYLLRDADWYEGWYVQQSELDEGDSILPSSTYYFRLRSTVGEAVSEYSNVVKVTTLEPGHENEEQPNIVPQPIEDAVIMVADDALTIWTSAEGVSIEGLQPNSNVKIYNLTGLQLYGATSADGVHFVPLSQRGIFIVRVETSNNLKTYKIVK